MMEWTDRHCRSFHRMLAPHAWLYTEMVTAAAIVHGDRERLLGRTDDGARVVLQLGGNEPDALAQAARHGRAFGYDEINLNCGCPSDRVQSGRFGAALMAEPAHVATLVRAMRDAVDVPVTVKHRTGIDRREDYGFVRDFVGTVHEAGCEHFIVHARNAWLDGLSPKENREVPPLRPAVVQRLAADFPHATFELNGGLTDVDGAREDAGGLHGIMLGRAAYHDPWVLHEGGGADRDRIVESLVAYLHRHAARGVQVRHLSRHVLGLYRGTPGARHWRRELSDAQRLARNDPDELLRVRDSMRRAAPQQPA